MNVRRCMPIAVAACVLWAGAADAQSLGFVSFSAIVDDGGNTTLGRGVQASSRVGRGVYVVEFARDLSLCTMVATVRGRKTGFASVRYPADEQSPNSIRVLTFTETGARANLGFNVLVNCAS